ncbi:hypothetical protein ACFL0V_05395 [Nanoarchaeota archaeon]
MLSLFLIKLFVAVGVVVLLSIIAEHVSPKMAGILSGYPTGSAISLFFFGLEQGTQFAADSAVYNMIGLVAMMSFIYFYYRSSSYFSKFNIVLSSIVSIFGYFVVIWLLHFIKLNKFIAVLIPIISMIIFIYLFKEIQNIKIRNKIKITHSVLFLRAFFAACIILTVIGTAKLVGPTWAGLFSAFPTTLFPLIVIVHFTYDTKHVHTVIKNVPIGIGSLILYSLTISIVYPLFGIYIGTIISFIVATVYIFLFQFIQKRVKRKSRHVSRS